MVNRGPNARTAGVRADGSVARPVDHHQRRDSAWRSFATSLGRPAPHFITSKPLNRGHRVQHYSSHHSGRAVICPRGGQSTQMTSAELSGSHRAEGKIFGSRAPVGAGSAGDWLYLMPPMRP
jgi:hypothetical protein